MGRPLRETATNNAVNRSGEIGWTHNGQFIVAARLRLSFGEGGFGVTKALDKFGQFVVAKFRDAAIDHADALLAAHWKAPGLQGLQTELRRLTDEQKAIVRRCMIEVVDSGLHDFLFALQEEHDADGAVAVVVDGRPVAADSDGLHGDPYSDEGWLARFSKHGPHPDPA